MYYSELARSEASAINYLKGKVEAARLLAGVLLTRGDFKQLINLTTSTTPGDRDTDLLYEKALMINIRELLIVCWAITEPACPF